MCDGVVAAAATQLAACPCRVGSVFIPLARPVGGSASSSAARGLSGWSASHTESSNLSKPAHCCRPRGLIWRLPVGVTPAARTHHTRTHFLSKAIDALG